MIDIGKSLKSHRENAGISQLELSKRTGIKQQNISRWESNQNNPNIIDCMTLATFYQISIDYLVGFENDYGEKNYENIIKDNSGNINSFNNNSGTINFKK